MQTDIHTDRDGVVISESRRMKAQLTSELQRANSRCIELDTLNKLLRDQLEAATEGENVQTRELERTKDRIAFETSRLNDRITELTMKIEHDLQRILQLEKELANAQETVSRKDRVIREEKSRAEVCLARMDELRAGFESDITDLQHSLQQEKLASASIQRKAQKELEDLKRDVEEKIPQIAASAVHNVEQAWLHRLEREKHALKHAFDIELENLRRENMDLVATNIQNEARTRAMYADERAELDRLRRNNQRMQRTVEDLETELDHRKRDSRSRFQGTQNVDNSANFAVHPFDQNMDVNRSHPQEQFRDDWAAVRKSINATNSYSGQRQTASLNHHQHVQQARDSTGEQLPRPPMPQQVFTPMYAAQSNILHDQTMSTLQHQLNSLKQQLSSTFTPAPAGNRRNHERHEAVEDVENSLIGLDASREDVMKPVLSKQMYSPESLMETPYMNTRPPSMTSSERGAQGRSGAQPGSNVHGHSGYSSVSTINSDDEDEGYDDVGPAAGDSNNPRPAEDADSDDNYVSDEFILTHTTHGSVNTSGAANRYATSTPLRTKSTPKSRQTTPHPATGSTIGDVLSSPAGSSIFDTPKSLRKARTKQQQERLLGNSPGVLNMSAISMHSDLREFSLLDSSMVSSVANQSLNAPKNSYSGGTFNGFVGGIAMLPKEDILQSMSDGGYHQNYWKVKYQR
jgi:hypothetical protein